MSKSRDWCGTAFTATPPAFSDRVKYGVAQREVCPESGKEHWQFYFEVNNAVSLRAAQIHCGLPGCHLEPRRGTQAEARAYCMKEETRKEGTEPLEHGDFAPKAQGKRSDLESLKRAIDEGKTEAELWDEMPGLMMGQYKSMRAYHDVRSRRQVRTWMTKGSWHYGPTGVGKSHKVFEDFDPETHFVFEPSDNGWWDSYEGQSVVIINDFRGEIKYGQLLQLLDKWPKKVPRRGREAAPFLAKEIRITSSMAPQAVYSGVLEKEDSIDQLLRRLEVIPYYAGAGPTAQPFRPFTTPMDN